MHHPSDSPVRPAGTPIIAAHGLVKRYGDVTALAGLDLTVPQGSVLALLGPNGAGKTTAVSVLTTLIEPDAGTATVAGADVVSPTLEGLETIVADALENDPRRVERAAARRATLGDVGSAQQRFAAALNAATRPR